MNRHDLYQILLNDVALASEAGDPAQEQRAFRALALFDEGVSPPWVHLTETAREILRWQQATFPTSTYEGSLKKMRSEVAELAEATPDKRAEEIADVFFMILAVADHSGISLADALQEKLAINKARTWNDNGDGSSSHVKTEEI